MAGKASSPRASIYAVLDANVLLPPRLSDVLFDMSLEGLYLPRWTADIETEFKNNYADVVLAELHVDATAAAAQAERRLSCYRSAVPEHEIMGHAQPRILAKVPNAVNAGDRHVAAAALQLQNVLSTEQGATTCLVTHNLKHFAAKQMGALGVEVLRPGEFIDLFCNHPRMSRVLSRVVRSLKDPPYTQAQLLGALQLHGATKTVALFSGKWRVKGAER